MAEIDTFRSCYPDDLLVGRPEAVQQYHDFHRMMQRGNFDLDRIKYVKSGSCGHTLRINRNKTRYAIKVVAYPLKDCYGDHQDPERPENAEIRILVRLSQLVLNGLTPHVVLPIMSFYCPLATFSDIRAPKKCRKYTTFTENAHKGEYDDQVSILVSEWCSEGDFGTFLRRRHGRVSCEEWRCLLFQIVFTLACIQTHYPTFRHNDLKPNNILVSRRPAPTRYRLDQTEFHVPATNLQLMLWDYDFASIEGVVQNKKTVQKWTRRLNITPRMHRYYDIHYFFNSLDQDAFYPHLLDPGGAPDEVQRFIRRVLPEQYSSRSTVDKKVLKSRRLLLDVEYVTPTDLIMRDPFFGPYRVP